MKDIVYYNAANKLYFNILNKGIPNNEVLYFHYNQEPRVDNLSQDDFKRRSFRVEKAPEYIKNQKDNINLYTITLESEDLKEKSLPELNEFNNHFNPFNLKETENLLFEKEKENIIMSFWTTKKFKFPEDILKYLNQNRVMPVYIALNSTIKNIEMPKLFEKKQIKKSNKMSTNKTH